MLIITKSNTHNAAQAGDATKSYPTIIKELIQAEEQKLATLVVTNASPCGEVEPIQMARLRSNGRIEALNDVLSLYRAQGEA
jgi:hypothetical protein